MPQESQKGFTLIELILVITLMALLGTAALVSYFSTTRTFQLLSDQQYISSGFRMARSNAIYKSTAKNTSGTYTPERFGILIDKNITTNDIKFTSFADTGLTPFKYDVGSGTPSENDIDYPEKTFTLKSTDYIFKIFGSKTGVEITSFPVYFFYDRGTGDMAAYHFNTTTGKLDLIPKTDDNYRYLAIQIKQNRTTGLQKNIVINQISGLPEELETLPN